MKPLQQLSLTALWCLHGLLIVSFYTINLIYNTKIHENVNIVNVLVYSTLSLSAIYLLMGNFFLIFSRRTWYWGLLLISGFVYLMIFVNHRLIYDVFPSFFNVSPGQGKHRSLREFFIMALPRLYYYSAIAFAFVFAHRFREVLIRFVVADKQQMEANIARLEIEKHAQKMELRALAGHFNPHFQYNELNGIEAEILELSGHAAEPIAQRIRTLSDILRYNGQTVLNNHALVVVEKELDHLQSFIQSREQNRPGIRPMVMTVNNPPAGQKIVAMTLIYIAENAYTHGRFDRHPLQITLDFGPESIRAVFRNEIGPRANRPSLGSGLAVVRRRLELAMGGRFTLDTTVDNDFHELILSIDDRHTHDGPDR